MNTRLLRLARRIGGVRYWSVPGHGNPAKLVPSRLTPQGWGPAAYWPAVDAKGPCVRGVDLDRHLTIARHEIRALIEAAQTKPRRKASA